MSLWNKIRDAFRKPAPPPPGPTLRNKPGGLAWINREVDCGEGSRALVGRVVTTVRTNASGMWEIDPPQRYAVTTLAVFANGTLVRPGDTVTAIAIRDCCLTPIPDVGEGERDESLAWLPPVPAGKVPERA